MTNPGRLKIGYSNESRKVGIHLYIEEDLIEKAREKCLNISAFLRKKLQEELGMEYEAF